MLILTALAHRMLEVHTTIDRSDSMIFYETIVRVLAASMNRSNGFTVDIDIEFATASAELRC